ncbi:MAG TPA: hypothetical protein V6D15_08910 [Oculatellaceae cyanobacterium]|jgi:hypothetical protein
MNIATYNPTEDGENIFIFDSNGFYQEAIEDDRIQDGFLIHAYGDKRTVDTLIQSDKQKK